MSWASRVCLRKRRRCSGARGGFRRRTVFDSESALVRWFKIMQRHDFASFETLRATFPTADKVGDFIVFNIGGNKYRLITAIHFNRHKVYIRHVLTQQEYDRGAWKP
jgi:mRNA interferase HigB